MARECVMTGKKGSSGNRRSHSLRATRRRFGANIQKKRVLDPKTGKYVRMKVATSYLRTLAKQLQGGR
ncbi:MAG: 50S ribosomal protein L28 [Candidatus Peribacteraceae bacterium]